MTQISLSPFYSTLRLCLLPLLCHSAQAAVSNSPQSLPTVEVKGDASPNKGGTEQGYRVSEVNLGPLGNKKALKPVTR